MEISTGDNAELNHSLKASSLMEKETELKRKKLLALSLLGIVTLGFICLSFFPQDNYWIGFFKAGFEAAMVGALADWFAVVALFKRIPIPFISRHTEIIPKNKDRIADNLAIFIQEKFLDADSLVGLIKKHDPAQRIADWLTSKENADSLGKYAVNILGNILDLADDKRVQKFIRKALDTALEQIDLSKSAGSILETLTKEGRHQELLTKVIEQLINLLQQPHTRQFVSSKLVGWIEGEYPLVKTILPTQWLGEKGADAVTEGVEKMLDEVTLDRSHEFREYFDQIVKKLITQLKTDKVFLEKGEELKQAFRHSSTLNTYIKELWTELRDWLKKDMESDDSVVHDNIMKTGQWIGKALAYDIDLRKSLNDHLEEAAQTMAPDFAQFLTHHIRNTIRNWEVKDLSRQVELNIGSDLQYIRINGTLVGGAIGFVLYLFSSLISYGVVYWR